eukprot:6209452-Pleurochrysis_carterae.AAC.1
MHAPNSARIAHDSGCICTSSDLYEAEAASTHAHGGVVHVQPFVRLGAYASPITSKQARVSIRERAKSKIVEACMQAMPTRARARALTAARAATLLPGDACA